MKKKIFQNKHVVVTGASRGIGRAIARAFAAQGANVTCTARTEEQLAVTLERIEEENGSAQSVPCDLTVDEQVTAAAAKAKEGFGPVAIIVNNAGGSPAYEPTAEVDSEAWRYVYEINYFGTMRWCKAVIPHMQELGGGRIVNFYGGGAFGRPIIPGVVQSGNTSYGPAKAAVCMFTEHLAIELVEHNIQVNTLGPGSVGLSWDKFEDYEREHGKPHPDLEAYQKDNRVHPSEPAKLAMFLSSPETTFITGRHFGVKDDYEALLNIDPEVFNAGDYYRMRRMPPPA